MAYARVPDDVLRGLAEFAFVAHLEGLGERPGCAAALAWWRRQMHGRSIEDRSGSGAVKWCIDGDAR